MELTSQFVAINTTDESIYEEGNILNLTFIDEETGQRRVMTGRILDINKETFVFNGSEKYQSNDIYVIKYSNVLSASLSSINGRLNVYGLWEKYRYAINDKMDILFMLDLRKNKKEGRCVINGYC